MEDKQSIYREILIVSVGELICVAVMLGIFALTGHLDGAAIWGGVLGGGLSILNFFLMAVGVSLAADKAQRQDVKGGKRTIRMSMTLRYLLLIVVLVAAGISKRLNILALVLPLLFVRPVMSIGEFFRKSGEPKK